MDFDAIGQQIVALISTWGLKVVGALVFLFVGRWFAKVARGWADKTLSSSKVDATLRPFIASTVYYLVLVIVFISVLGIFGIETTSLVAILGAAGLAIGLALQGTLTNIAAGVMLLIFRPFQKGDLIEAADKLGYVQDIGLFTTVIHSPQGVKHILPNGSVYGSTITNVWNKGRQRWDFCVGVGYTDDLDLAEKTIRDVVAAHDKILKDPAPFIGVEALGSSSVDFSVWVWTEEADWWQVRADFLKTIKVALEEAGCSIPFPQRDIHIVSDVKHAG